MAFAALLVCMAFMFMAFCVLDLEALEAGQLGLEGRELLLRTTRFLGISTALASPFIASWRSFSVSVWGSEPITTAPPGRHKDANGCEVIMYSCGATSMGLRMMPLSSFTLPRKHAEAA